MLESANLRDVAREAEDASPLVAARAEGAEVTKRELLMRLEVELGRRTSAVCDDAVRFSQTSAGELCGCNGRCFSCATLHSMHCYAWRAINAALDEYRKACARVEAGEHADP